jgi:hypothetical protein
MLRALLRVYWLLHVASPFPVSPYVRPIFFLTDLIPLIVAGTCGFASTFHQLGPQRQRALYGVAVVISLLIALYRYGSRVFGLMHAQGDLSLGGFVKTISLLGAAILGLISRQLGEGYLWSPFAVGFTEFIAPVVSLGLLVHFLAFGRALPVSEARSGISDAAAKR